MNLKLYDGLMREKPEQQESEWWIFLEICEAHLKKHEIKNPIVVELGIYNNGQKSFWEKLLGAEHIGIDKKVRRCDPDIRGNTHDPKTMEALKKKLRERPINILFIDASHNYDDIKKDFEMYSPLCSDIIAFHDTKLRKRGVGKFWDELKTKHRDFLFLSIYQHRENRVQMGIGMIIKK